jgi:hypothetical protein
MGAHTIKRRDPVKAQIHAYQALRRRARLRPGQVTVTAIVNEASREIRGIAIDRETAGRFRDSLRDGEVCELVDYPIQV